MLRLAVVGDVHGCWGPADARWFEGAAHDLVVFVGDLAGLRWSQTLAMSRGIGEMKKRSVVLPGNHDASHPLQLASEMARMPRLGAPFAPQQGRRLAEIRAALGEHELGAYSHHVVGAGPEAVTLIAGRPHSMGGPDLAFAPHLAATWGVHSLEESASRLRELVDSAPTDRLMFVAHNGPTGLGEQRSDLWGCDFRNSGGDWGDRDLRQAIDHAQATGRRVLAVLAGHMHRRLRGGGDRAWKVVHEGVLHVNAAVVPRVHRSKGHHHVEVCIDGDRVTAHDRYVHPQGAPP